MSWALQLSVLATVGVGISASASVGPSVQSRLARGDAEVRVVIVLHSNALVARTPDLGRPGAAIETQRALKSAHDAALTHFFELALSAGVTLSEPEANWLSPAVTATVQASRIPVLAELAGVAAVVEDAPLELVRPVRELSVESAADATAAGQDAVGARTLWHQGLTGRGTLVASLDTGVDGLHPALASRYRGRNTDASQAWFDAQGGVTPNDPAGHGTHTMGTVLGCEPGDTVGIAPEAEWIAAGVVDRGQTFSRTLSDLLAAFQWLADPDGNPETKSDRPDVVLNSWGIPQGVLPSCDATFFQAVDHLEALGTVVIFSAGNEGPGYTTLRQPADRGDLYLSCFSVGAVDALDPVTGCSPFSSRGPASCNATVIKPELVAPGVNVRSCAPGGGYRLMSGTSMAAPSVAGAVCLLRQYNPDATPMEIKEALVQSATDVGAPGPDFGSGYGLLNIPGAIALLTPPRPLSWRVSVPAWEDEVEEPVIAPAGTVSIRFENLGRSLTGVQVTVRPLYQQVTLLGESGFAFDYLSEETGSVELPVTFQVHDPLPSGDRVWFELSLSSQSPRLDTSLVVGVRAGEGPMPSAMAVHSRGLSVVTTNTGRFDTSGASAVSVQAPTFTFDGVPIPLTGGLEIHTRTRDISSFGSDHDFEPAPDGQLITGSDGTLAESRLRDTRNCDPAGVEFIQRVLEGTSGPGAYVLVDYEWQRLWSGGEAMQPGSWFHWQPASGAQIAPTRFADEICLTGDGLYFGFLWLAETQVERYFAAFDPQAAVLPLPVSTTTPENAFSYWSRFRGTWQDAPSGRFAVAFVAGHTQEEWEAAAARARVQYADGAAQEDVVLPDRVRLEPNYPNPFNPATVIRFALDLPCFVRLEVFNSLGRHVSTLVHGDRTAGVHEVHWQAADERGLPLPSGTYFIRLEAGSQVRSGKMCLVR